MAWLEQDPSQRFHACFRFGGNKYRRSLRTTRKSERLQNYVTKRSQEPGKRWRKVGASTIKNELVTFRSVWRWGITRKSLEGDFPNEGMRFPKDTEKSPFQTWNEIERQFSRGAMTLEQQADLWDCLFLSLGEIDGVLKYVEEAATQPIVYPMFVMR